MNHFLITTGIRPVGAVWATIGDLPDGSFTDDIFKRTEKLGKDLASAWENKINESIGIDFLAKADQCGRAHRKEHCAKSAIQIF